MKKVYVSPEFELLKLRLYADVLTSSIETNQNEAAGGEVEDPLDPFNPW